MRAAGRGSLYWVIGRNRAREKIIAIEPFRDKDGMGAAAW